MSTMEKSAEFDSAVNDLATALAVAEWIRDKDAREIVIAEQGAVDEDRTSYLNRVIPRVSMVIEDYNKTCKYEQERFYKRLAAIFG